jgi:hypothetical protein
MYAGRANVGRFERHAVGELALDGEGPLRHLGAGILPHGVGSEGGDAEHGEGARPGFVRGECVGGLRDAKGAAAGAYHRAGRDLPGDADAWAKVLVVGAEDRVAETPVAGHRDAGRQMEGRVAFVEIAAAGADPGGEQLLVPITQVWPSSAWWVMVVFTVPWSGMAAGMYWGS